MRIGGRAYGPLLFMAGMITVTPVSAVPGVPGLLAFTVVLIVSQMLVGCEQVWLPRWLLRLQVRSASLEKGARGARRPAQALDQMLRPRIIALTEGVGRRGVALACSTLALLAPPLELTPVSNALLGGHRRLWLGPDGAGWLGRAARPCGGRRFPEPGRLGAAALSRRP